MWRLTKLEKGRNCRIIDPLAQNHPASLIHFDGLAESMRTSVLRSVAQWIPSNLRSALIYECGLSLYCHMRLWFSCDGPYYLPSYSRTMDEDCNSSSCPKGHGRTIITAQMPFIPNVDHSPCTANVSSSIEFVSQTILPHQQDMTKSHAFRTSASTA